MPPIPDHPAIAQTCVEPLSLGFVAVVLASHARAGWRHVVLGSVARRNAHIVPTPVIVCPLPRMEAREPATDALRTVEETVSLQG
jgi:hypothetical protein